MIANASLAIRHGQGWSRVHYPLLGQSISESYVSELQVADPKVSAAQAIRSKIWKMSDIH